jgi:hypothetical protein
LMLMMSSPAPGIPAVIGILLLLTSFLCCCRHPAVAYISSLLFPAFCCCLLHRIRAVAGICFAFISSLLFTASYCCLNLIPDVCCKYPAAAFKFIPLRASCCICRISSLLLLASCSCVHLILANTDISSVRLFFAQVLVRGDGNSDLANNRRLK